MPLVEETLQQAALFTFVQGRPSLLPIMVDACVRWLVPEPRDVLGLMEALGVVSLLRAVLPWGAIVRIPAVTILLARDLPTTGVAVDVMCSPGTGFRLRAEVFFCALRMPV